MLSLVIQLASLFSKTWCLKTGSTKGKAQCPHLRGCRNLLQIKTKNCLQTCSCHANKWQQPRLQSRTSFIYAPARLPQSVHRDHVRTFQVHQDGSNRACSFLFEECYLHGCRNLLQIKTKNCLQTCSCHANKWQQPRLQSRTSFIYAPARLPQSVHRDHVRTFQVHQDGSNRACSFLFDECYLHGCRNLLQIKTKTVCKHVHVMQINGSNPASKAELLSSTHLHGCRNPCTGIMSEHSKYTRMAATAPAASCLMSATCTVAAICCKSKQKTVCKHVHVMQINGSNPASKAELLSSTHLHGCRNPCTGIMSEHSKYTRMAATAPAASYLMSATCKVATICCKSKQKTVCKHVHVMQINGSNRASKAELLSSTHLHGCRNPCTGIMSECSKYTRMAATAPAASCLMSATCTVAAICCKSKQKTVCKHVHVMQINGSNRASKAELLSSTHLHGCRNPCTGIMSECSKYTRMAATAPAASCLMSATCTVAAICCKSKQKTVCKHVHVMQINGSNPASKAELLSSTHLHGCRNQCTGIMSECSTCTRVLSSFPDGSSSVVGSFFPVL